MTIQNLRIRFRSFTYIQRPLKRENCLNQMSPVFEVGYYDGRYDGYHTV